MTDLFVLYAGIYMVFAGRGGERLSPFVQHRRGGY